MASTRKVSRGQSRKRRVVATTIPELKESFDAIERATAAILQSGKEQKSKVREFQETWRKIFGRPVDAAAAEAYLQVKARTVARVGAKTRKAGRAGAKQRGGAGAISGAPVDFQVRPGVDGAHGSFLPYVAQGLGFYNTINQQGMFKGCGTEDITPKVPVDLGSNKVGGGVISDLASTLGSRPFGSSAPPSIGNDIQTVLAGRSLGASPAADEPAWKYL